MAGPARQPASPTHPAVTEALRDCRSVLWSVAVFSGGVNLLMLAGPLYMLQVYDRVLSSRSVPTLVALTVLLVGAYAFQGILDLVRSRIVMRAAALLDKHLGGTVHAAVVAIAVQNPEARDAGQPVRDLDQVRNFLTGSGPIGFIDLPWMPLFLAVCFLLHPWLGFTATAGALLLVTLTLLTERATRKPSQDLAQLAGLRAAAVETDRRNSESVVAMGMADAMSQRWAAVNDRYLAATARAGDVAGTFGSISKVVRLLLQSAMLGMGAWLVIRGEMTAGAMIAASIMMGRALAPLESVIQNWRGFVQARQSVRRLSSILARLPPQRDVTKLPGPVASCEVDRLTVVPPGGRAAIVNDIGFRLEAGEALGIIGPSGAGKTSLVRALVGIWPAARGSIRLDGARTDQWDPAALGRHVGFVSQNVELFDGTIAENISRMAPQPDSEAVLKAAAAAGAHDMILKMPLGYDTPIGDGGAALSGGQRQRIALARALYGDPFLLVLDEAGSNLDNDGEAALTAAILAVKARGGIVVSVAHRPSALSACDKVMVLAGGSQQAYGPRDEVLKKLRGVKAPPAASATNLLKVVHGIGSASGGGGDR
ncbi:MAG: type I secretion system permease/ATPase [Enhydrobacter sp.]|nr:type I secretion system permease/ATPase [Enhydrobacter sp.]